MEPEKKPRRKRKEEDDIPPIEIRRDPVLYAKYQIEKLAEKGDQPIALPDAPARHVIPPPVDFVPNVQGACTGAGSGDFHIYRSLRRKEYARTKMMSEMSEQEKADEEYRQLVEARRLEEEEKRAKKREKRKRRKQKTNDQAKRPKADPNATESTAAVQETPVSDASSQAEN